MEKPIGAIEFGSKKLKLVVGYELQGVVYVIYSLVKPYGHNIEAGTFIDPTKISEAVKEINNFTDEMAKLKLSISEACLALPPYGLQIYQLKETNAINEEEGKVSKVDVRNVYKLMRNDIAEITNELIDIIPDVYILDEGRSFSRPPFGVESSSLSIDAKIHTLPKSIVFGYSKLLTSGGISAKRLFASPYAASQLIASDESMPSEYILVDIGSNITTVSLIGQKTLFDSRVIEWGGDRITEKIIQSFNINESDAERYKITYGIDKREMNFKAPICTIEDEDGNKIRHYNDELNAIIKGELDILINGLLSSMEEILVHYDSSFKQLPMVLVGGGSRLNGLVDYILPKIPNETAICYIPKALGARDATFTNCLGMILASAKNISVYDETHPRVGKVTRDEKKEA